MALGENVSTKRKNKLSQEYIAEQLGVSRQAVSKWETGQSEPSIVHTSIPFTVFWFIPAVLRKKADDL